MSSAPSTLVHPSTTDLRESRHDIEMQSPMQGSFIVDEKEPFTSPSRSRSTYMVQSPITPVSASMFPRPPVRKYSTQWWHSYWDKAVIVGFLPRLLYGGLGLTIIALWIGLTFYFAHTETVWRDKSEHRFTQHLIDADNDANPFSNSNLPLVSLEGSLKNFDTVSRSLTIEWSGLWQDYGNITMTPIPLADGSSNNIPNPIEIYADAATTVWIWGDEYSAEEESSNLYYKLYNETARPTGMIGLTPEDSFSTQISFKQGADGHDLTKLPLYAYPYDQWAGSISFVANNYLWDKNSGLNKSSVFPLIGAVLRDHTLNWRIAMNVTNDCNYYKPSEQLIGAQVDPEPSSWTNATLENAVVPCRLKLDFTATRPPLVKFAAVLSLIVNWTSTFFVFVLTCEVIVMRRGFMMSGTDLLGVTFTSLFALPSVRALLPGAPEFGALIDLVGIIPNVIIISICIVAIAVTKLNKSRHHEKDN